MKDLFILIGCDCDHDRKRFNYNVNNKKMLWDGYLNIMDYFNNLRNQIYNYTGFKPVITLNIRADNQIKYYYGRYDYCFNLLENNQLNQLGKEDEIAWHHHQYKLKQGEWIQELDDEFLKNNIINAYEEIQHYNINTIHSGWCFQNTTTINTYNDIGIKIDYSAVPGMKIDLKKYVDYSRVVPNNIYIPNRNDHQKADNTNINKIVEIPVTTINAGYMNKMVMLGTFIRQRRINPSMLQNKKTYLQCTINPLIYKRFLRKLFLEYPDIDYIATYFHPDEVLPDKLKSESCKRLYRSNYMIKNIIQLIKYSISNGRRPRFINFFNYYNKIKSNLSD